MPPKFTLITPSLNQAHFLRHTIDSVLAQDYPHLHYIVVDGGSNDNTRSILDDYTGQLQWLSEPDRGQAHALNKGLRLALADSSPEEHANHIIGYLGSDDMLLPGALAAVSRHYEQNPQCDVVYGAGYLIDQEDRVLGQHVPADFDHADRHDPRFLCQPATFWRRDLMTRFGLFDESLHYCLAYEYWLRLAHQGVRFQRIGRALACSRRHPRSKTHLNKTAAYREALAVGRRKYAPPPAGPEASAAPQLGYGQYLAYWKHRCHEAAAGWPRWLRFLPRPHQWLSLLHYRWDGAGRRLRPFFSRLHRAILRRILRRAP